MKKILYILMLALGMSFMYSCEDQLETNPTDKVSGPVIFSDATSAQVALNGIYRATFVSGWSVNWSVENGGLNAIMLAADLMADDHLMISQGSGWFFEDYRLNIRPDYTNKNGRPYAYWKFFYTIVSNANYIIAEDGKISGDPNLAKSVVGQAYALRAMSYFYLIQLYQQTYKGNENAPGVPLYTEPTTNSSVGKPRGTVQQVYDQINLDIAKAITMLDESGLAQEHPSHIDYYVANGLKARIDLVQENFRAAADAAVEALSKPGLEIETVPNMAGMNSVKYKNVMWGVEIIADQSTQWASYFSHIDSDGGMYGARAPHAISKWLYDQLPATDARKSEWWRGEVASPTTGTSNQSYCQTKFKFANVTNRTGDYVYMRAEEMLLIAAEAEARLENFVAARAHIKALGEKRDSDYATRLVTFTDSKTFNSNTVSPLVTLVDEILFQRRVELWSENPRLFDLQRLKLGYSRDYAGSNHTQKVITRDTGVGSKEFIMLIPQSEIDGNENISSANQNPL